MFQIDFSSRVPIYEQLYSNVIKLASAGVLRAGDRLPPVRTLATELGINPNTVAKSYKMLEFDGYIYSTVGRGSFVTNKLAGDAEKKLVIENLGEIVKKANVLSIEKEKLISVIDNIYSGGENND